jgi:hypothetical protein
MQYRNEVQVCKYGAAVTAVACCTCSAHAEVLMWRWLIVATDYLTNDSRQLVYIHTVMMIMIMYTLIIVYRSLIITRETE